MSKRKYRGKYPNARDCVHAKPDSTKELICMVEVLKSCRHYGKMPHNLMFVQHCQVCECYKKRDITDERE